MEGFSDNSSFKLNDKVTVNQNDDYGSLIDKISLNKEESSIKNETIQLLGDARGIIELNTKKSKEKGEKVAREYEDLRLMTILALKENNDITRNELSNLKNQVEKKNQDMADFYAINTEMLNLETNKDIVMKTLKLLVAKKQENEQNPLLHTIDFSYINKGLLNDINIIKATRPENTGISLFSKDILDIQDEHLNDEKFVEDLLKLCDKKAKSTLLMKASRVMNTETIMNIIGKINSGNIEASKIDVDIIPIDLIKKDEQNLMYLNLEGKNKHINKTEEITKDSIDKILNSKLEGDELAYEIEYFLNSDFTINDISDENIIKILKILNDSNRLENAPKLLLGLNDKVNLVSDFLENEDSLFIRYLPNELRKNHEIQKTYIDILAKKITNEKNIQNMNFELTLLEINDIEIAKYFYNSINALGEAKANIVFSNFFIRESINRIANNEEFKKDENNRNMLEHLSSFDGGGENLLNAVEKNKANIEKVEKNSFSKYLMDKLDLNGKIDVIKMNQFVEKIKNLDEQSLGKQEQESKKLYKELVELLGSREKVGQLITEIKEYQIKENVVQNNKIKEELKNKKFDKFSVNIDNIESDFEDFLSKKIAEEKAKNKDKPLDINAISKNALEEYISKNKKEGISTDEESKIKGILNRFLENRNHSNIVKNSDSVTKVLSGEMKKEDFDKIYQKGLEEKYDFKEEKRIVEKQLMIEKKYNPNFDNADLFIPTENNFISTSDNKFTLMTNDGKIIEGITKEEKELSLKNPEAAKNLINFHDFFKKLNLEGVWKYRGELMNAIGDIYIDPNDADSIKTEELRKFGNKILTFIANAGKDTKDGEKQTINLSSIQSVNMELQKFSMSGSPLNDKATFNRYGEDRFTAFLREQGIIGGAYFKINGFKNYL